MRKGFPKKRRALTVIANVAIFAHAPPVASSLDHSLLSLLPNLTTPFCPPPLSLSSPKFHRERERFAAVEVRSHPRRYHALRVRVRIDIFDFELISLLVCFVSLVDLKSLTS